jgi:hypothetical protein
MEFSLFEGTFSMSKYIAQKGEAMVKRKQEEIRKETVEK